MRWVKYAAKAIFLVVPLVLGLGAAFIFFILPLIGPEWTPLILGVGLLAVLIADWIWPLDTDT